MSRPIGRPTFIKFDKKGEEFTGELTKLDSINMNGKEVDRAWFEQADGAKFTLLLGSVLQDIITSDLIGTTLKIVFKGKVKSPSSANKYDDFDVFDESE